MRRREFAAAVIGACVAGITPGCKRRESSAAAARLVVSARPNLYMAPFYLAQERGYFRESGLSLELQPLDEGYQTATLLAGGKLDIAFSALTPSMISAIASGAELRIVAGCHRLAQDCSDTGRLWGNRASFPHGISSLAMLKQHLKGRRIGLNSLNTTNGYYLHVLLEKAGLAERDVTIVQVRYSEAVTAVVNGKLDAFMSADQFSAQRIADSPRLTAGVGLVEILPGFQYRFVSFGKKLLHGEPAVGARFLRAYHRGVADFRAGQTPRFLDEFARSNALDLDRARSSCRANNPQDGAIDDQSIASLARWYFSKGYCPRELGVAEIVDRRFLDLLAKGGA